MSRSRAMDPEIKALRAIERAMEPLDQAATVRILEFACARALNLPGFDLELGRKNARMAEALRWLRREVPTYNGDVRDLIDRCLAEAVKR